MRTIEQERYGPPGEVPKLREIDKPVAGIVESVGKGVTNFMRSLQKSPGYARAFSESDMFDMPQGYDIFNKAGGKCMDVVTGVIFRIMFKD